MKPISEMTIGEFGAFVSDHLLKQNIGVVLSGGGCVSIYSHNRYQSFDLDFIGDHGTGRKMVKKVLTALGFVEKNKYFTHPESKFYVEFPSGPLAVGGEPVKDVVELVFSTGKLRLLSPTECVKDRLAAYYHWQDRQCLEQAAMVTAENQVDLDEIERWSESEGMSAEYRKILKYLTGG